MAYQGFGDGGMMAGGQQAPGAYPWGASGGQNAGETGGAGDYDYNYGYDYNQGYSEGYQEGYQEDYSADYGEGSDGYGTEWYGNGGGGDVGSNSWQGGGGGGMGVGGVNRGRGRGVASRRGGGDFNARSGFRGRGASGDRGRGTGVERGRGAGTRGRGVDRGRGGGGIRGGGERGGGRGGGMRGGRGGRGGSGFAGASGQGGQRGGGGGSYGGGSGSSGGGFGRSGRGRGAGDNFGGGRGRGGGFRGGRGGGGNSSQPIATADTGVGLASLGDLVQSAKYRKMMEEQAISPHSNLQTFVERWKTFAQSFTDCGNAISNLECSLKASKLNFLQLHFDCNFLVKCHIYSIFTGALHLHKIYNQNVVESVFLARGMGLNKKAAKMDCYDKAYKLLLNSSITEVMSQEDCGEEFLRQEVQILHAENPRGFMELLKKSSAISEMETTEPARPLAAGGRGGGRGGAAGMKRPLGPQAAGPSAKKGKFSDRLSEMLEYKSVSLAPTKKVGILMNPSDPLMDKMAKLKELLKEEGITKLHIVPKIDQIAHKTAIHIQNVYRFEDVPILGFESRMPVYCEIYFDGVFMAHGNADYKRNGAMQQAYSNLANVLYTQPLDVIVNNPRRWESYMVNDPDICNVVTKWQGEDNNSLLTSNLANMKQMMQSMPNVKIPIERMVLTEHESDKDIENVFKALELSATRNLMLLECEIVRNADMKFTCSLSLQGRVLTSRTHSTKNGAKRLCSEAVMNEMKKSHDYIYVKQDLQGKTITKEELFIAAAKKKSLGEPPAKIFIRKVEPKDEALLTPEARQKLEEDRRRTQDTENIPENIQARALFPWIAAAMYDIIDEYYQKVTLEDLMLDVSEMPKSQRDVVTSCATKMGLRVVTKLGRARNAPDCSLLRRTVTAQDMSKILQLHGGESGRYKLVSCRYPSSLEELEQFRKEYLESHRNLVEARNNDDPDAESETPIVKTEITYNPKPIHAPTPPRPAGLMGNAPPRPGPASRPAKAAPRPLMHAPIRPPIPPRMIRPPIPRF